MATIHLKPTISKSIIGRKFHRHQPKIAYPLIAQAFTQ